MDILARKYSRVIPKEEQFEMGDAVPDFSFSEWYWIIGFAFIAGTIHHRIAVYRKRQRDAVRNEKRKRELHALYAKRKNAKVSELRSEVWRTRLVLEAWMLRHPKDSLRHVGAKVVLWEHVVALRDLHDVLETKTYRYPPDTAASWMIQYDDPYWRAIWHLYNHRGEIRRLPPLSEDYPRFVSPNQKPAA